MCFFLFDVKVFCFLMFFVNCLGFGTDCNCVNFWSHQLLSDLADFRDGFVISLQMLSHPADTYSSTASCKMFSNCGYLHLFAPSGGSKTVISMPRASAE